MSTVEVHDENHRHICTARENRRVRRGGKLVREDVKKTLAERRKRIKQRSELDKTVFGDLMPNKYFNDHVIRESHAAPPAQSSKHDPRDVVLKPKREVNAPVVNLADLMRQAEANTETAADARLDEEEPVRIDMTDLSRRLDRANARA